jgi:hypothetical protein
MKSQQPSFVVLSFLLLFLNVSQAQILGRLHEHSSKRLSRQRRRLHWYRVPREEKDQGSHSHYPHHDGDYHGHKTDLSLSSKSRKGPKGHSKSKKGPPLLPPKSDSSSKSRTNGGPMGHSYKSKQIRSKGPENDTKTVYSRKMTS